MAVSKKKRKQILRAWPRQSAEELAQELGLKRREVEQVLQEAKAKKTAAVPAAKPAVGRRPARGALAAALILCAGLLVYHNALSHPFHFDDRPNILLNYFIHLRSLDLSAVSQAMFKSAIPHRPVANLTLALNYYFGRINPAGYQAVNLAIHILNGVLVYLFLAQLLSYLAGRSRFQGAPDLVALVAALLWLVNPVQSQSVVYIVQRMNSLAVLFYLLALVAWFRFRISVRPDSIRSPLRWLYLAGAVISFGLGLGSKEIVATLPLAVLLIEIFCFRDLDLKWLRRYAWTFGLALLFMAVFGVIVLAGHPLQQLQNYYAGRDFTLAERLLTEPRVIWHYLLIFFFPIPAWMNLDYDIPVSTLALSPPSTLPALIGILALLVLAVVNARRTPLLSFATLWFFLQIAIESTFIPLEIAFDHRLYLPSVGLVLLVAVALLRLAGSQKRMIPAAAVVAVLWAALAWARVQDWRTEEALWRNCVRKSPLKARTVTVLGDTYGKAGDTKRAEPLYLRAIRLDPKYDKAYNNLANIYNLTDRREQAIETLKQAIAYNPRSGHPYNNLGKNLLELRRYPEAADALARAVELMPYNAEAHNNYAAALGSLGKYPEAEAEFRRSLEIDPDLPETYSNLAILYQRQNRLDQAIAVLQNYLKRHPDDSQIQAELQKLQAARPSPAPP